jgi:hypothetical protein
MSLVRHDPELGTVRVCPKCLEEWPLDAEFWHMRGAELSPAWPSWCIACCAESGSRCGRRAGHRFGCRSRSAMASDAARKHAA